MMALVGWIGAHTVTQLSERDGRRAMMKGGLSLGADRIRDHVSKRYTVKGRSIEATGTTIRIAMARKIPKDGSTLPPESVSTGFVGATQYELGARAAYADRTGELTEPLHVTLAPKSAFSKGYRKLSGGQASARKRDEFAELRIAFIARAGVATWNLYLASDKAMKRALRARHGLVTAQDVADCLEGC